MSDLISRQAAIEALRTCYDTETITMDNGDEYINYGDAVGEIEQLPSIQPKKGRWIKNETTWTGYKCSVCGDVPYMHTCMGKPMYSYCPYCGSYNGGENEI